MQFALRWTEMFDCENISFLTDLLMVVGDAVEDCCMYCKYLCDLFAYFVCFDSSYANFQNDSSESFDYGLNSVGIEKMVVVCY